jgi:LysR family nitrogen assimilation transcriptional regulator
VRGDLDLVVCVETDDLPAGITTQPLLDDPLSVLAPGDALDVAPTGWGPWVTFPSGSHTRQVVARALRRAGAGFEVVAESNQPEVLREMALLGVGWTVLPLAGLGSVEGLQVVRRDLVARRLVLARRTGARLDPAVDELATALLEGAS